MPGRAKFSRGDLSMPRSRPTTVRPALVSSRAMMLPDQPMPTMTASTDFIVLAMTKFLSSIFRKSGNRFSVRKCDNASREIGDGLGRDHDLLAAIFQRLAGIGRGQARI